MLDVTVIEDAGAAEICLDPVRARLLAELAVPGSATTLAATAGIARQKVDYQLKCWRGTDWSSWSKNGAGQFR
jgi:hypothetical protein